MPPPLPIDNPDSPYYYGDAYSKAENNSGAITNGVAYSLSRIDGGAYDGPMQNNMRHGVASCSWPDGTKYHGDWSQNVRHGNGVFTTPDGMKYEGEWINDVKHGKGRLTYQNGETVTGFWVNDRLNGLATKKSAGGG